MHYGHIKSYSSFLILNRKNLFGVKNALWALSIFTSISLKQSFLVLNIVPRNRNSSYENTDSITSTSFTPLEAITRSTSTDKKLKYPLKNIGANIIFLSGGSKSKLPFLYVSKDLFILFIRTAISKDLRRGTTERFKKNVDFQQNLKFCDVF